MASRMCVTSLMRADYGITTEWGIPKAGLSYLRLIKIKSGGSLRQLLMEIDLAASGLKKRELIELRHAAADQAPPSSVIPRGNHRATVNMLYVFSQRRCHLDDAIVFTRSPIRFS